MYNEELKNRFISHYATSISKSDICVNTFNAIAPFEKEWDADCCTRSKDELEPVLEQLLGMRSHSKWLRLNVLREYVKWCVASNIPGACDGMLHTNPTGLDKIRRQMVSNPLQLQRYLDIICDPESDETTDLIYRAYLWFAFIGLDEDEAMNVRSKDLDFENMILICEGNEYEIYRESIQTLKRLATLDRFVNKHPVCSDDRVYYRDRVPGDILMRGVRAVRAARSIRSEITKRGSLALEFGKTDKKLGYHRVWLSGIFYRMNERERAGLPVDFSGVVADHMAGYTYKYNKKNTEKSKIKTLLNEYETDYQRWKAALL